MSLGKWIWQAAQWPILAHEHLLAVAAVVFRSSSRGWRGRSGCHAVAVLADSRAVVILAESGSIPSHPPNLFPSTPKSQ